MKISFTPVWFDSMGAKSSCTLVKTPDISVLIDPGVAIMQPSFPATELEKLYWKSQGEKAIKKASKSAKIIVISHYHYDHYFPDDMEIYKNKLLFAKNPNEYINDSQRRRAENFYSNLCKHFGEVELGYILKEGITKEYSNPLDELPLSSNKDFGDYNERRKKLLVRGIRWFNQRANKWNVYQKIPELRFDKVEVRYAEGREFYFGDTKIKFSNALFHGVEFSRVGWIFSTTIEYKGEKFIHTSDINGPVIEDYAAWLIKENPNILVLDGPMTYLLGYVLNKTNFRRTIENILKIMKESEVEVVIYDHHLTREAKFRENTLEVWEMGDKLGKTVITAAEFLGKVPKVLECET